MSKLKGKIRDKVKQVLLIEGAPSVLYIENERISTSVEINNRTFKLGSISDDFVEELRKIPAFKITQVKGVRKCPKSLKLDGVGHRTHIRFVGNNTHIQVGGQDEKQLAERIDKIKDYLRDNGVNVTERCHWICSVDKNSVDKKEEIKKEIPISSITIEAPVTKSDIKSSVIELITPKQMSEKTKTLREIGIKAIKKKEAVIKMGLAAIYE